MNKLRGEVSFEANGETYTLRFSIDAICEMESAVAKPFSVAMQEMSDPDKMTLSVMRAVLWAGLREHHPELTLKEAGELIVPAGGIQKVMVLVSEAITAAFPEEKRSKGRPPKGAGTGLAS